MSSNKDLHHPLKDLYKNDYRRSQQRESVHTISQIDQKLFDAINRRCNEEIGWCLDNGANVNAVDCMFEESALHLAAKNHWQEGLQLLLSRGALARSFNKFLQTPLHFAVCSQNVECVKTILDADKTCVGVQDMRGYTALHDAASGNSLECMRILLEHEADPNKPDNHGETPFHKCVKTGCIANILMLLNHGADLKIKNSDSETVLSLLIRNVPNALNKIFDCCLISNTFPACHKDFEITINLKPLLQQKSNSEMSLLRNFVSMGEHNILRHPLIQTLIFIKWRHIVWWFILKLIFYMIFSTLATILVLKEYAIRNNSLINITQFNNAVHLSVNQSQGWLYNSLKTSASYILACMVAVFIINELITFMAVKKAYFRTVITFVNILIFVFSLIMQFKAQHVIQYHLASFYVLILWSRTMYMIGQFPTCGIYVSMFLRVTKVFLKIFVVYSCLLISFALSFHLSFTPKDSFSTILDAFLKTMTLVIGEVDYDGMFHSRPYPLVYTSHIIFFLFLMFVAIVLSNLLVALAVSDVQALEQKADLERLKKQTQLLYQTDLINSYIKSVAKRTSCYPMIKRLMKPFFQPNLIKSRIFIIPNTPKQSRHVYLLDYKTKHVSNCKVNASLIRLFCQRLNSKNEHVENFAKDSNNLSEMEHPLNFHQSQVSLLSRQTTMGSEKESRVTIHDLKKSIDNIEVKMIQEMQYMKKTILAEINTLLEKSIEKQKKHDK